jgi:hypothetical protein
MPVAIPSLLEVTFAGADAVASALWMEDDQ